MIHLLCTVPISILCFALCRLYPGSFLHPAEEWRRAFWATGIVAILGGAAGHVSAKPISSCMAAALLVWAIAVVSVIGARTVVRKFFSRCAWWGIRVVVLGGGSPGANLVKLLQDRLELGLRVVGWLDDEGHGWQSGHISDIHGGIDVAPVYANYLRADYALIAMPGLRTEELSAVIRRCGHGFRALFVLQDLDGLSSLGLVTGDISGLLGFQIHQNLFHPGFRLAKRALDLTVAASLGFALLPLLAALSLAVTLSSPGPVFYGHRRIGRGGRCFTVWKFRSMAHEADRVLSTYLEQHPDLRREWLLFHKLKKDPRVTWIGRVLRKTSLDELPQLWNIVKGDMSLVGPRPIVDQEIRKYGDEFEFYRQMRPGVTGLWQVSGRNNTTYAERVAYDRMYVRNWSLWLDIYILVRTLHTVLTGDGAY